jgi:Rad3-related DNA helicase
MTYFGLLSVTPKQVMVSATVGDKDNFDDNIGLKYTQNPESKMEWIESTFNFDKSPIYFLNRYKMSFAEKEKSLEKLKPLIYKVCNNFAEQKGIIQTGTYAIAKDIIDNAPAEIKSRLLYYNGSKEKTEVILKHMMSKNTILIGPTLNEGIDLPGDLCRFIIITKMPYPTIKDRLVDAKMKIFPYWYNSTTSNSIIQGIGRGNRFADDYCTTYIFDACFLKLYTDTQKQYPEYIQRRIKIAN